MTGFKCGHQRLGGTLSPHKSSEWPSKQPYNAVACALLGLAIRYSRPSSQAKERQDIL